jgi:steroid 5-alpha reductase family enzyme
MLNDLLLTLGISLLIQAVFFAFAAWFKTDKVTDLSYGLSFIAIAVVLFAQSGARRLPPLLLTAMVIAWALRLAIYLLIRVIHMGRDVRFDGVREHFWPFFKFWLGQGIAVWLIMLPVTLWFSAPGPWTKWMTAGWTIWIAGLALETVADAQKFVAKRRPNGASRWMDTGLWKYSRHPNYFGELLCWWGVFAFGVGTYQGWQWAGIIGPVTITYLLLEVTGIPPLETTADRKWGSDPAYQAYLQRTNRLLPWKR